MKKFQFLLLISAVLLTTAGFAQTDKSKRASPPATASETIASGAVITINYSQPSLKGRVIGENIEPMKGKIWRMGANEATVFETSKDVKVNGQSLPAGKYSIWGLWGDDDSFTIIFNKDWNFWGTQYDQHKNNDLLKIAATPGEAETFTEKLTYTISKGGKVTATWGKNEVSFMVD